MHRSLWTLSLAVAVLLLLPRLTAALPGDVIAKIPTPGPTPTGLAYDGKLLWVADRLEDRLSAVDPASGEVVKTLPSPGFVPRGLAWDGQHLWCVDGEEKRIMMLDVASGLTLRSIEAPMPSPQGIAWDGKYLWLVDDADDVIAQISIDDGTTIKQFPAPMSYPTGLTWWNGYLWCADRREDRLYLVDPDHGGEVVLSFDAPGAYARGLATDGRHLWNADYQEDAIFKLVIDDGEPYKVSDRHKLHMLLTHEFRNYGPGELRELNVYIAMPVEMPNQKFLSDISLTHSPLGILHDRWQQAVAHYQMADLPLAERIQVQMQVDVELAAVRHFVFPHRVGKLADIPKDIARLYLVDEDKYRIGDPIIQNAVKQAVGEEKNPYWVMRNIHRYLREHMYYELAGGWNVAPRVLERGNGSCSEYTFVFISMCRAAGIPARYVGAIVIRGDEASADEVFHRWSQVYLPGYGWVHIDPQGGDKEKPGEVAESIGVLSNRFLITTQGGGASEYLGWNYNYDQTWISKGPVKIHTEAVAEWSPLVEKQAEKKKEQME
jgi:sugar lactone lactonase YvrE